MSVEEILAGFFSSQERGRGEELARREAVNISSASDTDVRAFIKASSPCKVSLSAEEVSAENFSADCTCPVARKGNLCRHIWAVLLKLEENSYDFLEGKETVEKVTQNNPARSAATARAEEFKKQNYEKQKARAKGMRQEKKATERGQTFSYPPAVEEARVYFQANGFAMNHPLELDELLNAKKLLSRVFHPDKGGTHDEILTLNENYQIIFAYLKS